MDVTKLPNPLKLDKPTLTAVVAEVTKGDKVAAVSIVFKASRKGLKESKDYVDQLWALIRSGS